MKLFDVSTGHHDLHAYLYARGVLSRRALVKDVRKAGDGNMNVVLRIQHSEGSLILKQARPFVQKYPSIPAPIERIQVEAKYYQAISGHDGLRDCMPKILDEDPENYILLLEDLGDLDDMTSLYRAGEHPERSTIDALIDYLLNLHHDLPPAILDTFPDNLELRKLNYEHLFVYPYLENNGLDLDTITPGLQLVASSICADESLKRSASRLGEIYLSPGRFLLHGDFYPGSWFRRDQKIMILDPEFAFVGPAEYDLGIMIAHLLLADANNELIEYARSSYMDQFRLDQCLVDQFAGMEIIRRLIGLAQLPLKLQLEQKTDLIAKARILMTQ